MVGTRAGLRLRAEHGECGCGARAPRRCHSARVRTAAAAVMADSKRQLKIKTDSVTRLGKELSYYVKEQEGLERKLSALRQSQADPYDIKKTVRRRSRAHPRPVLTYAVALYRRSSSTRPFRSSRTRIHAW